MMLTSSLRWCAQVNSQLMVQNVSSAGFVLAPRESRRNQVRRINVDSESAQRDNESVTYYQLTRLQDIAQL